MADNDNEVFHVIQRDPSLRDVGCIWCKRTRRTNPELEFFGNEEGMICSEHADQAIFAINNADRLTLQQWLDSTRLIWEKRTRE